MSFHFPRYSWLIMILTFTVTAFLTVGWFRVSTAELQVLIVPSDAKSTALATQVVETLAEDIKTVAFYEQLTKQYPEQAKAVDWDQRSLVEKRELVGETVEAERVNNSGVIQVTLVGSSVMQLQALATRVAEVLRAEPRRLYGDTAVVSVVVLEQPFFSTRLNAPALWLVATLSIGFLVSMVLMWLMHAVQTIGTRSMITISHSAPTTPTPVNFSSLAGRFQPHGATLAETPPLSPLPTIEAMPTKDMAPAAATTESAVPIQLKSASEMSSVPNHRASAVAEAVVPAVLATQTMPGNLPFVDAEEFSWEAALPGLKNAGVRSMEYGVRQNATQASATPSETLAMKETGESTEEIVPVPEEPTKPAEPTEEELKRRLNQLLRGEM